MTKSEKWLGIAKIYLMPYRKRNDLQKGITSHGLCFSCGILGLDFDHNKFYEKSFYCPIREYPSLCGTFKPIHDEWRGIFALLMSEAVKTEKEW